MLFTLLCLHMQCECLLLGQMSGEKNLTSPNLTLELAECGSEKIDATIMNTADLFIGNTIKQLCLIRCNKITYTVPL